PCIPARRPGGGPNESPRSPSTGLGLTVGGGRRPRPVVWTRASVRGPAAPDFPCRAIERGGRRTRAIGQPPAGRKRRAQTAAPLSPRPPSRRRPERTASVPIHRPRPHGGVGRGVVCGSAVASPIAASVWVALGGAVP